MDFGAGPVLGGEMILTNVRLAIFVPTNCALAEVTAIPNAVAAAAAVALVGFVTQRFTVRSKRDPLTEPLIASNVEFGSPISALGAISKLM